MSDENERSVASAGSQPEAIMSWEQADQIIQDQRAEIERLRVNLRLADAGFTLGQPTLTDEEREAIERLCEAVTEYSEIDRKENGCHADDDMAAVAVARGLLERLG
jgi:hypothetical protein